MVIAAGKKWMIRYLLIRLGNKILCLNKYQEKYYYVLKKKLTEKEIHIMEDIAFEAKSSIMEKLMGTEQNRVRPAIIIVCFLMSVMAINGQEIVIKIPEIK
jgi:hypothetical protein